jgi:hypothetical protein
LNAPALIGSEALELPFHRYRRRADDRAKFPLLTLGESHAAFPADEEEIAPLEEGVGGIACLL